MKFLLFLLLVSQAFSQESAPNQDTSQVPVESFKLSDESLKIETWATFPMLHNPTGMDVDVHGNIWVTEAVNYRRFRKSNKNLHFEKGDRVSVLRDTNGDGRADQSHVFVQDEDLVAPLGVAVLDNKIYVSCSPSIWVYTDVNRNLVFDDGDTKEKFLTGFGGKDHDHSLHKLEVGPDGRIYVNSGNAGPHVIKDNDGDTARFTSWYTDARPKDAADSNLKSDDGRIWNGGFIMSVEEDGSDMQVLGHNFRNSYGQSIDSFGDVWMNDNDDTQSCRTTWIMRYANLGYTGVNGTEGWKAGRRPGQTIPEAHWRQDDPGVIPSGHIYGNASPTGMVYWEIGDGLLLSCEAGQNVIWAYKRERDGAGFKLEGVPFISSTGVQDENYTWHKVSSEIGKWFRPSDIVVGPDGSLYISDWFDPIVGGHLQNDKHAYGTIYRVSPKKSKAENPDYDFSTLDGSLAALKSPAVHVRYLARKNILAAGNAAVPGLKKLFLEENKFIKGRSLFLLAELNELAFVEKQLFNEDTDVAIAAYRALEQNIEDILPVANQAIKSENIALRREIALSLRDVPLEKSQALILELISSYEGDDRWYLEALGQACDGKEAEVYQIIRKDPELWDSKLEALAWRLHPTSAVDDFKSRATNTKLSDDSKKRAIDALAFIRSESAASAMLEIFHSTTDESLRSYVLWWLQNRKGNHWSKHLVDVDLNQLDAAAQKKNKLIAALLESPNEENLDRLLLNKSAAKDLIEMIKNKKAPDKIADMAKQKLLKHSDTSISSLANIYLNENNMKYNLEKVLSIAGNPKQGKALFHGRAACFTCHVVHDRGGAIGPELTQIKTKFDRAGLLDSIVNPSSGILLGYESITVTLKDGTVIAGMLELDKDPLVIRNALGQKEKVAVKDISKKIVSDKSLMPEASAIGLNEQDLSDILSYLDSIKPE